MPVVFQNVGKEPQKQPLFAWHGRSSWTFFWKAYMMISIEELEVFHPKVCHAVSRQAQSYWTFSMERCTYYQTIRKNQLEVSGVASAPDIKDKEFHPMWVCI